MSTSGPFGTTNREVEQSESLLRTERHRARNAMQVIASLLSLQVREIQDPAARELFTSAQDSVKLISLLYERLSRAGPSGRFDFSEVLKEFVTTTVQVPASPVISIQVFTEPLLIDIETAIPLGLIAHELLGDALRQAFVGKVAGRIEVHLKSNHPSADYTLMISDDGVSRAPLTPGRNGNLSAKIVDVLIRQLKARLSLESVSGTRLAVRFPVPVAS